MTLFNRFKTYISQERLWHPGQTWLVAVSGGLDSVVLTHLCAEAEIDFRIAHCNFQLRGEESERDERFVRDLAAKYNRPLSVQRFDIAQGASVQAAARELRYAWFRTFATDGIATAHHLDDNIETLLMNFFKGTGVAGLRGMLPLQDGIVRPLLFARREDLEAYAKEEGLDWVEDSSNATDKYSRNFVRHRLVPLLEERYPRVVDNLADNLSRFREVEVLYRQALEVYQTQLLEKKGPDTWQVSVIRLGKAVPLGTVIYELFRPFGFTPAQSGAIQALLDSPSGRYVSSATHRVLRDRRMLLITPTSESTAPIVLDVGNASIDLPEGTLFHSRIPSAALSEDAQIALLDAAYVHYPLVMRRWKTGDYFYPLGMRKKKKLARFFIDAKLSKVDKEKAWVLESQGRILWVVGRRIDDRFKICPSTKEVIRLEWQPH